MNNAWEWTEADLMDLVKSQVPESLTVDCKASKALECTEKSKDELTKDDHSKMTDGAYLVNWRVMSPRSSPQDGWTYYSLHRAANGMVRFGFHNEILTEAQAVGVPGAKWYAPDDQPITI